MTSYINIVQKYLQVHKKKTNLIIFSVIISVTLITGIFSMMDIFMQFEKIQVMHDYGNYHIAIKDATVRDMNIIKNRIDVQNTGAWKNVGNASVNNISCQLGGVDQNFARNLDITVIQGKYPTAKNEIMVEKWASEDVKLPFKIGNSVPVTLEDGSKHEYTICGICNDNGFMKSKGVPSIFLSMDGLKILNVKQSYYLIEFKSKANMIKAEKEIKSSLNIAEDRIVRNNHLLAVIGQSTYNAAVGIYQTGAILFIIVLLAGVIMIYNTFNISVMERVRQFGLLRCIGASRSQIKKIVRREGFIIALRAIPFGLVLGIIMTFICCAILKFYNNSIFGEMPLFSISITGISAGILIGFVTVFIASLLPANKASKVSPINAVTGNNDVKVSKSKKRGLLTKIFRAETALGINNATIKRKTLFLMSCSIAISIAMFLGFNVLVDFLHTSLKTTKPYTPDITLKTETSISQEMYNNISSIKGIKKVYGRILGYVDASFDISRLTKQYKDTIGVAGITKDGLFIPKEKTLIISYDKSQLKWAKEDLIEGELSENNINANNGVIAVLQNIRDSITVKTTNFKLGDKVYINTSAGKKEFTVMGILRSVPFSDTKPNLTTFITTEKICSELTGKTQYDVLDIQLNNKNQEQTINNIKSKLEKSITLLDSRQKNTEMNQTFFTMAVFVYGFVAAIALISILNIINTMNTSIASKTRYLGVMRAIGMSNKQLNKMVLAEAGTYALIGCFAGCILGILLQEVLIEKLLTSIKIVWTFPTIQIILIIIVTILVTAVSVINPLKRIKSQGISEVIGAL